MRGAMVSDAVMRTMAVMRRRGINVEEEMPSDVDGHQDVMVD